MKHILSFLFVALIVASFARGAAAHAVLLDADPPDGGIFSVAPTDARLHFNEPVTPVSVRLIGPDGQSVALSDTPHAVDDDVRLSLPAGLGVGGYILSYRVISLDTHPIGGSLSFVIGTGNEVIPVLSNSNTAARWETVFPFVHGTMLLALCLALGCALFKAFVATGESEEATAYARPYVVSAALLAAVAAVVEVGVRGAGLTEASLSGAFSVMPWRIALSTAMGTGLGLVLAGLACGTIGYVMPRGGKRRLVALAGVLLASSGLALTSHAALAPPVAYAFPAFVLHVAVAAFWFGSLPLLALTLARTPLSVANAVVIRFSALAVWGVAVLLFAGVILTRVQSGDDLRVWTGPAWTGSSYGPLLACKLVMVLGVLVLALYHKRRLTPGLASGDPLAVNLLRRSIGREIMLMVGVLALATSLGSFEPPRSIGAATSAHDHSGAGVALYVVRQGYGILLEMSPAATGANEITLRFSDTAKDGARVTPLEVTVGLALPEAGIEPLLRRAKPIEDGAYRVELMPIPTPGLWQVQVDALITDFDKLLTTIDMPIEAAAKP